MPNIIEQQDLLKGLPDARLAMLLQNPVADIPPFLVAAEAQRRQAIRQQFAQNPGNESVVDSLTRQLAPQRMQAPAQITPPVPQTPDMQGVMALQQQQQMMQAAQAAQGDQQMAGGGPVRRFAGVGYVRPRVDQMAAQVTGGAQVDPSEEQLTLMDRILRGMGYTADFIGDPLGWREQTTGKTTSQTLGIDPQSIADRRKAVVDAEEQKKATAQLGEYNTMNLRDIEAAKRRAAMPQQLTPEQAAEQSRLKKVYQQYGDSHPKPEEVDEDRERLAALYDQEGPSDWEKSQKWFSMAEQFLDPEKTTMQSIAGAGDAFAGAMSEQAKAERLARLDKEKGLYEYDMGKKQAAQEAALAERKVRTDIAVQRLDDMSRRFYDIDKDISDTEQLLADAKITPEAAAIKLQRLKDEKNALGAGIGTLEHFLQSTYNFQTIPTVDTKNNTIR